MLKLYKELCAILGEDYVKTNEPMSGHTTFQVGGPAAYFVTCRDIEQLKAVIALVKLNEVPYYVLGNGSNLLVGDGGFDGLILYMGEPWKYCRAFDNCLAAGAGLSLPMLARNAWEQSLEGLEFAAGIPGTVGGGVVMNAGAYGFEMKDVLREATVLSEDGQVKTLSLEELELGYRKSCVPEHHYLVLEAVFELKPGVKEEIKTRMDDYNERRRSKQPLEYPSAGSTFKRPAGFFAGKLIDDSGLRGYRVGGAQISEKHCGFVINKDHATAADVIALCGDVRQKVKEKFDVELHMEVKKLGTFL